MCSKSVCNMFKVCSKYSHNMFAKCPNYVEHLLNVGSKCVENISNFRFQISDFRFQIRFKICPKTAQNMSKVPFKICQKSIQRMSEICKNNVSTCSKLLSKSFKYYYFRHCRGQQTRNPALPQPSSGCRATQSM